MYRASIARQSAKAFQHIATNAGKSFTEMASSAILAVLQQTGVVTQAERMNRRRDRFIKRLTRNHSYGGAGLNGYRAVERRRRQIAAGSLRVENGLVE